VDNGVDNGGPRSNTEPNGWQLQRSLDFLGARVKALEAREIDRIDAHRRRSQWAVTLAAAAGGVLGSIVAAIVAAHR
jgi:hypothetical protein